MVDQGWEYTSALMRCCGRTPEQMVPFLSEELLQKLKAVFRVGELSLAAIWPDPEREMEAIHYSWFIDLIEKQPDKMQPFFCTALFPKQREKVAAMMRLKLPQEELPPLIASFLRSELYFFLEAGGGPPSALPEVSSFFFLLQQPKGDLLTIIDLLAIHDLADHFSTIVDKRFLQAILLCLTQKEKAFLKTFLQQRSKFKSPPLDLKSWRGEGKSLKKVLHRRGLSYLAALLKEEGAEFSQRLLHHLDTGRATFIKKAMSDEASLFSANVAQEIVKRAWTFWQLYPHDKEASLD